MMLKKLVLPTAVLAAFAFTPAMADNSGDTGSSKADRQHEAGSATHGYTAGAQSAQTFDELDTNQDGKLDEDELNAWGSTAAGPDATGEANSMRAEQMLERYDEDGDGALSREELNQGSHGGPSKGTGSGMKQE